MRYFLHIAYDGSDFSGWQRQPDAHSIQQEIETNLEKIFKRAITVIGCGRTDAGVHASQYVFHIDIDRAFEFDLKFRLNKNLPDEISVFDVLEVGEDRHARYDASSRTYEYFFHLYKDPVLTKYSSYYELEKLDVEGMKKAAALLLDYDNYRFFCKQPDLHNHTLCIVSQSKLFANADSTRFRFSISANRFLRGMIRLLVAYILKVGTGELSLDEFENFLATQPDVENKMPAFPNGLFLAKVEYPYLAIAQREGICSFMKEGLS